MLLRPNPSAAQNMSDAMFEAATDCFMCQKKFQVFRRKHRCRSCGNAVCGSCARSHKVMPSTTIVRYNNEPVRVCDRCVHDQHQMALERRRADDIERARARQLAVVEEEQRVRAAEDRRRELETAEQRARDRTRAEIQQRELEAKHLGPRPDRTTLRRSRSLGYVTSRTDCGITDLLADAAKRAHDLLERKPVAEAEAITATTAAPEADECAICLDPMVVGDAIVTTACGHAFHWRCLHATQRSDTSNYDKCPACRSVMHELQVKQQCDHPRVRAGHRFCRDCGGPVTDRDVKRRLSDAASMASSMTSSAPVPPVQRTMFQPPAPPTSYRASSHGALVRCPQCHIQMRVLPHMYNMRVACPSGHMFLVQVAGDSGASGGSGFSSGGNSSRIGMGVRSGNRGRGPRAGAMSGYPGAQSSYYRQANAYSEL